MAKEKPSIPKGTRDFPPEVMRKRSYILDTIEDVFSKYGYNKIETPSMENLSVLTGKYGDEGDQLLFKILNSGNYLQDVSSVDLEEGYKSLLPKISNKGLRYDLTVPLARFVVMNRNEITFPFKRYQIQPVWRADKPQKGRYREFLQCDADVVGSSSLLCEVEMVQMMSEVMRNLGVSNFAIRMNHRKILTSLANLYGPAEKESVFAVILDKFDKIGWSKVTKELEDAGFDKDGIENIKSIFTEDLNLGELESKLSSLLDNNGLEGLRDILSVFEMLNKSGWNPEDANLKFDPSLARGLSYYTGIIFEVEIIGSGVGSVSGGGRYDNLTGIFGMPDVPATGFSFGIDRLYDALENLNVFPDEVIESNRILIVHFDEKTFDYGLSILGRLRKEGLNVEMYPDLAKMNKQLTYANRNSMGHVLILGEEEIKSESLTLKDMKSGNQQSMVIDQLIQYLKAL